MISRESAAGEPPAQEASRSRFVLSAAESVRDLPQFFGEEMAPLNAFLKDRRASRALRIFNETGTWPEDFERLLASDFSARVVEAIQRIESESKEVDELRATEAGLKYLMALTLLELEMEGRGPWEDLYRFPASPSDPQTWTFVGEAAASGMIGNAAYDLVKATFSRLLKRKPSSNPSEQELILIARLATHARCSEIGFPVPRIDEIDSAYRVVEVDTNDSDDDRGRTYRVEYENRVRATVIIPRGGLSGREIEITVELARESNDDGPAVTDHTKEVVRERETGNWGQQTRLGVPVTIWFKISFVVLLLVVLLLMVLPR